MATKAKYVFKIPDFSAIKTTSKTYSKDFRNALWYLHYEADKSLLKKAVIKWIKDNTELDSSKLSHLSDSEYETVGKYCVIANAGGELPEMYSSKLLKHVEALFDIKEKIKEETEDAEIKPKKVKPNVQALTKSVAAKACGEIEGLIDEFTNNPNDFEVSTTVIEQIFKKEDLKPNHYKHIPGFYNPVKREIEKAISGEDEQLNEGYAYLGKRGLNKFLKLLNTIIEVAEKQQELGKIKRKPAAKKPVDKSKLVKSVKYLDKFDELNLESVNPVHIIGSKEVWVYNTKTRKIGHYIAMDVTGLSVKGTTICNYSDKSAEKTLRKPSEYLKEYKKASKKAKSENFDNIKSTEIKLKGRLNDQTIILEVVK